jgi:hypothetical protein
LADLALDSLVPRFAVEARTREALVDAVATALATITPQDVVGWFAHAGYPLPAPSS